MLGNFADETMIPQAPERSEFADEGSFTEYMEYYNANTTIRKNLSKVLVDGCMVNKQMLFDEKRGE